MLRLQAVTPSGVARGLLVLGAAAAVAWLIASAWYVLVPFQVGLALAYIALPLINRLDRVMPRAMATLLVILLQLGAVIAFVAGLIPPLVDQLGALASSLPGTVDVRELVDQLRAWVGTLPPETQTAVLNAVSKATTFVRENAPILVQHALELLILGSFTLLDWLAFLIGFLAIPTFLYAAMRDQPGGVRAVNRAVPSSMRQDFWAVLRIIDRTLSSYLRGKLLRAFLYGAAIASGLALLSASGYVGATYPLVLGMVAGVTYLIPNIGWLIGAIPAILLALTQSRETAVAALALYLGVAVFETSVVAPRIESRSADVHPAILMPTLVVASQVNLLLVILAAPLLVIARDLFRYAYGRLSDPAQPAGVLPGEQRRLSQVPRAVPTRASRRRSRSSGVAYPPPLDTG
jgi:predicted PurR-regulated permease PerM